jgi:hypothetical protein
MPNVPTSLKSGLIGDRKVCIGGSIFTGDQDQVFELFRDSAETKKLPREWKSLYFRDECNAVMMYLSLLNE